jgi:quercetin dioxygenase-like cupin family protein
LLPFLGLAQEGKKGNFNSVTKMEQVISGHLTELNGKYKLRVIETTYLLGGYIGEHHHAGPGVRYVKSGELPYIQDNLTRVFKEGDYFYESGDVTHTAYNKGSKPVVIINFEVLPASWDGASPIPVPNHDNMKNSH